MRRARKGWERRRGGTRGQEKDRRDQKRDKKRCKKGKEWVGEGETDKRTMERQEVDRRRPDRGRRGE